MILHWELCRFVLSDTSQSDSEIIKKAGFHWDSNARVWYTSIAYVAGTFKQYADQSAKDKLGYEEKRITLSRAIDSNFNVPAPDGLSYFGFQRAGVEYALQGSNTLIADEMGTGKSITTVGIINAVPGIKRILVVCPASLRINWSRELMKWSTKSLTGGFAVGTEFPDTDIVITNYEQVKKFRKRIDKKKFDLVVFDESHYLKNSSSQRTRASLGWVSETGKTNVPPIDAGMRLFLTGTPILNRPVELWPILRIADPDGLGASRHHFERHYCAAWQAPWGYDATGCTKKHLEDLQLRLRGSIMLRRLKRDILPQLPPKLRQIILLPADAARQAIQAELSFYSKHEQLIEEAKKRAEQTQSGDELSYQAAAEQMEEGRKAIFHEMARLRHLTGIAKIPYIIEYLEQALEQKEKVVFFGHHRDVLEAVARHFKRKAVTLHGGMTAAEKQNSIDRFQNDKSVKLFVGAVSIAVGFTLTASDLAVFGELSWVPGTLLQSEDRLHRIGQLNSVLIQHLLFDGSLDANMIKTIISKQEVIERSLG